MLFPALGNHAASNAENFEAYKVMIALSGIGWAIGKLTAVEAGQYFSTSSITTKGSTGISVHLCV